MTGIDNAKDGYDCPDCGEPTKLVVYDRVNIAGADEDQVGPKCITLDCDNGRLEPIIPKSEAADFDWEGASPEASDGDVDG